VTPNSSKRNKAEPILKVRFDFKAEDIIDAAQKEDKIAMGSLIMLKRSIVNI